MFARRTDFPGCGSTGSRTLIFGRFVPSKRSLAPERCSDFIRAWTAAVDTREVSLVMTIRVAERRVSEGWMRKCAHGKSRADEQSFSLHLVLTERFERSNLLLPARGLGRGK